MPKKKSKSVKRKRAKNKATEPATKKIKLDTEDKSVDHVHIYQDSQLNDDIIDTFKIAQLKDHLRARGLNANGNKGNLKEKLVKYIKEYNDEAKACTDDIAKFQQKLSVFMWDLYYIDIWGINRILSMKNEIINDIKNMSNDDLATFQECSLYRFIEAILLSFIKIGLNKKKYIKNNDIEMKVKMINELFDIINIFVDNGFSIMYSRETDDENEDTAYDLFVLRTSTKTLQYSDPCYKKKYDNERIVNLVQLNKIKLIKRFWEKNEIPPINILSFPIPFDSESNNETLERYFASSHNIFILCNAYHDHSLCDMKRIWYVDDYDETQMLTPDFLEIILTELVDYNLVGFLTFGKDDSSFWWRRQPFNQLEHTNIDRHKGLMSFKKCVEIFWDQQTSVIGNHSRNCAFANSIMLFRLFSIVYYNYLKKTGYFEISNNIHSCLPTDILNIIIFEYGFDSNIYNFDDIFGVDLVNKMDALIITLFDELSKEWKLFYLDYITTNWDNKKCNDIETYHGQLYPGLIHDKTLSKNIFEYCKGNINDITVLVS